MLTVYTVPLAVPPGIYTVTILLAELVNLPASTWASCPSPIEVLIEGQLAVTSPFCLLSKVPPRTAINITAIVEVSYSCCLPIMWLHETPMMHHVMHALHGSKRF
jgi:hypothetical protein